MEQPHRQALDAEGLIPAEPAEVTREYGPYEGIGRVHGVSHDGRRIWAATGEQIVAIDPDDGTIDRRLACSAHAGTAFDGRHLWQVDAGRIHQIDPTDGAILSSIPAPGAGRDSGLAWAEGSLWVGQYHDRCIRRIDPATVAVLATLASNRFVTGVSWVDGELWHGTWEDDASELRRVDPADGRVLDRLALPTGVGVSGLESDGAELFFCGGGNSGTLRAVRRPRRTTR